MTVVCGPFFADIGLVHWAKDSCNGQDISAWYVYLCKSIDLGVSFFALLASGLGGSLLPVLFRFFCGRGCAVGNSFRGFQIFFGCLCVICFLVSAPFQKCLIALTYFLYIITSCRITVVFLYYQPRWFLYYQPRWYQPLGRRVPPVVELLIISPVGRLALIFIPLTMVSSLFLRFCFWEQVAWVWLISASSIWLVSACIGFAFASLSIHEVSPDQDHVIRMTGSLSKLWFCPPLLFPFFALLLLRAVAYQPPWAQPKFPGDIDRSVGWAVFALSLILNAISRAVCNRLCPCRNIVRKACAIVGMVVGLLPLCFGSTMAELSPIIVRCSWAWESVRVLLSLLGDIVVVQCWITNSGSDLSKRITLAMLGVLFFEWWTDTLPGFIVAVISFAHLAQLRTETGEVLRDDLLKELLVSAALILAILCVALRPFRARCLRLFGWAESRSVAFQVAMQQGRVSRESITVQELRRSLTANRLERAEGNHKKEFGCHYIEELRLKLGDRLAQSPRPETTRVSPSCLNILSQLVCPANQEELRSAWADLGAYLNRAEDTARLNFGESHCQGKSLDIDRVKLTSGNPLAPHEALQHFKCSGPSLRGGVCQVRYMGQDQIGQDAGGLTKDFFASAAEAIMESNLFVPHDEAEKAERLGAKLPAPLPTDREPASSADGAANDRELYEAVGRFLATAVLTPCIQLPMVLSHPTYKRLAGEKLDARFAKAIDADFLAHSGIISSNALAPSLLSDGGVAAFEELGMQFFFVNASNHPLKPGGEDCRVTEENKLEYVQLLCEDKMFGKSKDSLAAVVSGFWDVLPSDVLRDCGINAVTLQLLLEGMPSYDPAMWRKYTEARGRNTATLTWFWEWVARLESSTVQEEKLLLPQLLQFWTGSARPPAGGFAAFQPQLVLNVKEDLFLKQSPVPCLSHTCFNTLDLQEFNSREELEESLKVAVRFGQGFGIA